jgi:hypothetical protein
LALRAVVGGNVRRLQGTAQQSRLALIVRAVLVAVALAVPAFGQSRPLAAPPSDQPLILGDAVIDRPPQDFAGLPSVLNDDPFLSPLLWPVDPPLGYVGPSGILPRDVQTDSHFVPMEDRWRIGFPEWDRYGRGHPLQEDYPFQPGWLLNPYRQNLLKGDYPILGQNNFLIMTATEDLLLEARQVPTPTTPFESTGDPHSSDFFGDPDQFFLQNNFIYSLDWVHGDGAFKPADWRIKVTQIFNVNQLVVDELAVVSPDVRRGTARVRTDYALEEWFFETKLADLSPNYDFASVRAGSQLFVSDFRGFIFSDTNRMVRLFGNRNANRDQFNLVFVDQTEKDTNSFLNTFDDRHQNTLIANYYRQDFIWPGYTAQVSYHFNHDRPSTKFDENGFLVRPAPVGVFAPHDITAHYLGWTGDGHINQININHAFYWVLGRDDLNGIAGHPQNINAQMFALEASYSPDWLRFRASYFFASGDSNANDHNANGFDTIFDNPQFAGGQFSFWQRQQIKLFGVELTNRFSLVPDLRATKTEGQSNFVNPGLQLFNLGADAELTPKLRLISNVNFLWFNQTEVLKTFIFQGNIRDYIGADLSLGTEYRPHLNNNIIIISGASMLIPGGGFRDIYNPIVGRVDVLGAMFMNAVFTY